MVRLNKIPTVEPLRVPLMRSHSQWPGIVQRETSAGQAAMGVI